MVGVVVVGGGTGQGLVHTHRYRLAYMLCYMLWYMLWYMLCYRLGYMLWYMPFRFHSYYKQTKT